MSHIPDFSFLNYESKCNYMQSILHTLITSTLIYNFALKPTRNVENVYGLIIFRFNHDVLSKVLWRIIKSSDWLINTRSYNNCLAIQYTDIQRFLDNSIQVRRTIPWKFNTHIYSNSLTMLYTYVQQFLDYLIHVHTTILRQFNTRTYSNSLTIQCTYIQQFTDDSIQ